MTKTGHQIQTDIYGMLKDTALVSSLTGSIYRAGLRPRDSQLEDLMVIFTTADAEQIQEGVVTLNVYVPDICPYDNGVYVEDISRCETLEGLVQNQVDAMTADRSNYKFKLKEAVHTRHDDEIHQSFVVARLSFRYFDNN